MVCLVRLHFFLNRVNGVGFNKFDAPTLTAIAEDYASQGWITRDQLRVVSRSIRKYHAQWGE